jgi:hypothetical protein
MRPDNGFYHLMSSPHNLATLARAAAVYTGNRTRHAGCYYALKLRSIHIARIAASRGSGSQTNSRELNVAVVALRCCSHLQSAVVLLDPAGLSVSKGQVAPTLACDSRFVHCEIPSGPWRNTFARRCTNLKSCVLMADEARGSLESGWVRSSFRSSFP